MMRNLNCKLSLHSLIVFVCVLNKLAWFKESF